MKCFTRLIALGLSLVLSTNLFAADWKCPSLAAIKAHGIDDLVTSSEFGFIIATTESKYDTDLVWHLMIMPVDCSFNENACFNAANTMLQALTQEAIPSNNNGQKVCDYQLSQNQNGPFIFAVVDDGKDLETQVRTVFK